MDGKATMTANTEKTGSRLLIFLAMLLVGLVIGVTGVLAADRSAAVTPHSVAGGEVFGAVFFDRNGNGARDAGERGLPGARVRLQDVMTGGQAYSATLTTADDGAYRFADLAADSYWLIETNPDNYISTMLDLLLVSVTDAPVERNLGDALPLTVIGAVYDDLNRDGMQGLTEQVISDTLVQIYADLNGSGAIDLGDILLASVTNDAQGNYALSGIGPGARILRIQPPGGASPAGYPLDLALQLVSAEVSAAGIRFDAGWRAPAPLASAVADRVLARFVPGLSEGAIADILAQRDVTLMRRIPGIDLYVLQTRPGQAAAVAADLAGLSMVQYAERDAVVQGRLSPADPDFGNPTLVYAPQKINAPAAWDITTGSPAVIVAVLDSGLALTHTEFSGRVAPGYDFINDDADPSDDHGHGTHVAGIVAAGLNNGVGSVGIAPGVSIMPIKVLDAQLNGGWAAVAAGIVYATDHGARIINLSLAGVAGSQALQDALAYATGHNVLLVAAGGNSASAAPVYPAYDDRVLAVSATNAADQPWSLSTRGPWIDVSAPGATVWSALWLPTAPITYGFMSGSSMAAAHVSGLAALLWSHRPELGVADVRALIQNYAVDLGAAGPDEFYGAGRINAGASLQASRDWVLFTPTPVPTAGSPTATWTPTATPTTTPSATPTITASPTATPSAAPTLQRVNSGGASFTDSQGAIWAADRAYAAGVWGYTNLTSTAKASSKAVNNTVDDVLYQKWRDNPGEYRFTAPNGLYEVRLRWAEFETNQVGKRLMQITLEGSVVETALDVRAEARALYTAYDKTYRVTVTDGVVNIGFARNGGSFNPMISAIEVRLLPPLTPTATATPTLPPTATATATATATPTRIPYLQRVNCGGTSFNDSLGNVWAADRVFADGAFGYTNTSSTARSSTLAVAGTLDDGLYQRWRDNPGEYRFALPNGAYVVTLRFAEFEVARIGDRKMKITLEGTVVEPGLDVYAAAGKAVALDRAYVANVTDGVLSIGFAKSGGGKNPIVSAIEVRNLE
jgi:thermitase